MPTIVNNGLKNLFMAAAFFADKRMESLRILFKDILLAQKKLGRNNFWIAFKQQHRGFKGKVDLIKKLAQKYTSVSTLYILIYEL